MLGYLTKYGKPKLFAFHWSAKTFVGASLELYNAWTISDLLTCPFGSFTDPSTHTP
jgi:hypothetical protein